MKRLNRRGIAVQLAIKLSEQVSVDAWMLKNISMLLSRNDIKSNEMNLGLQEKLPIRRPAGTAARVHIKGWASKFVFDDQTFSDMGNNVWLQSSGFESTAPYYDIEVLSSASMVTITTD